MKIIPLPTQDNIISHASDIKFYFAGGITNPVVESILAYDINGDSIVDVFYTLDSINK